MDPAAETSSCPHCHSEYMLVRVRPEPGHHEGTVRCVTCRRPLPAWDGDYALKYFLLRKPARDKAQTIPVGGGHVVQPPRS